MTADVTQLHPEAMTIGRSNEKIEQLTAMYEAGLRSIGAEPPAPAVAQEDDNKRFATLQAQAALLGVQLHRIDGDDGRPQYIATKWAMTASFNTLDATAAWLQRFAGVRVG